MIVLILCTGSLFSQSVYETLPRVGFCDLPKFKGQLVEVTAYYSGVDEYWSIGPGPTENCTDKYKVELNLSKYDKNKTPDEYNQMFDTTNGNYHKSSLIITMLGVFNTDKKSGSSKSGKYNAEFIVEKLEKVVVVEKKAQ